MNQESKQVFEQLLSLTRRMESTCYDVEEWVRSHEKLEDKMYKEYHDFVFHNFSSEDIQEVERLIGRGKFCTIEFYDALYELIDKKPRVLFEYKGYELRLEKDCWGDVSAFVFVDGRQYSEAIDYYDEQALIYAFCQSIDAAPASPNFDL